VLCDLLCYQCGVNNDVNVWFGTIVDVWLRFLIQSGDVRPENLDMSVQYVDKVDMDTQEERTLMTMLDIWEGSRTEHIHD
jgi:hypothetical protein